MGTSLQPWGCALKCQCDLHTGWRAKGVQMVKGLNTICGIICRRGICCEVPARFQQANCEVLGKLLSPLEAHSGLQISFYFAEPVCPAAEHSAKRAAL